MSAMLPCSCCCAKLEALTGGCSAPGTCTESGVSIGLVDQIANKTSAKLLLLPPAAAIVQGEGVHRGLQRARHLQRNGDE